MFELPKVCVFTLRWLRQFLLPSFLEKGKFYEKNTVKRAKSIISKARSISGVVASTKNKDTVIVEVIRMTRHPMYRKAVRRTKRFAAHVLNLDLIVGDKVIMKEVPPISKTKHFLIVSREDRKVIV